MANSYGKKGITENPVSISLYYKTSYAGVNPFAFPEIIDTENNENITTENDVILITET